MMRFSSSSLDLSRVDRSALWPDRSFQGILDERLVDLKTRYAEIGMPWDVGRLQTDSGVRLQRTGAYREVLAGQAIDDAQAAVLLAFARGEFLDRLGDQHATARLPLAGVANPRPYATNPEDWEDDERYRRRIQLAPEAFASAGTLGGYLYWVASASTDVRDVGLTVVNRGTDDVGVEATILSEQGDGTPSTNLLGAVRAVLYREDVALLTDNLALRPARIVRYAYAPTLLYRPGPDPALLVAQAEAAVRKRADDYKRVGGDVPAGALDAAAYVAGVERVLPDPALPALTETLRFQAAHLDGLRIRTQVLRD